MRSFLVVSELFTVVTNLNSAVFDPTTGKLFATDTGRSAVLVVDTAVLRNIFVP